jgi:hypothetical protein
MVLGILCYFSMYFVSGGGGALNLFIDIVCAARTFSRNLEERGDRNSSEAVLIILCGAAGVRGRQSVRPSVRASVARGGHP